MTRPMTTGSRAHNRTQAIATVPGRGDVERAIAPCRYINLPAIGKSVPLSAYIKAIRLAKANPTMEFKHGLTCWWSCTGAEVMQQFFDGMTDRINQGIPYTQRGIQ